MSKDILTEAYDLVHGPRQADYDHPRVNFQAIADGWTVIFGEPVTPQQVALAMIWTKVCRELHRPKRDNRVDIAGYAETLDMVEESGP